MHFDLFSPVGLSSYYFFYPFFLMFLFLWVNFMVFNKNFNRMKNFNKIIIHFFKISVKNSAFKKVRFSSFLISSFFLFFLYSKIWNLIPLKFSVSSKILFTLLFAFSIWLSFKISSLMKKFFQYFSHFTTPGSPLLLVPFMNIIEVISNLIRPITLGVRLAVNLLTGHLLLTMFCNSHSSFLFTLNWIFFPLYFFGVFIFMYEFCVCLVQALVYKLMLSQYFDEHSF